jgi:DNA-binding transcriptional LysR family regulator
MTLDQLRCLRAVANEGSFTRAASSILITQPALSMQVKTLERELGEPLFYRRGGAVTLTPSGRQVLLHARAILREAEILKAGVKALRELDAGELSLAVGDAVLRHLLLPALTRFRKRHPRVRLRIWNKTSSEICGMIQAGEADLGVITLPAPSKGLDLRPVLTYRQVAAGSILGASALPKVLDLAALAAMDLILLERGTRSREIIESAFLQRRLVPGGVMEVGSVDVQKDLARIGVGTAILPDFSVRGGGEQGLAWREIQGMPTATLALAARKGPSSRIVEAFRASLPALGSFPARRDR